MESRAPAAIAGADDAGAVSSPSKPVLRVLRSQAKLAVEQQIATPQKIPEPPRFTRGPGIVYSVRQVKHAVTGLYSAGVGPPATGKNADVQDDREAAAITEEQTSSDPRSADLARRRAKVAASAPVKFPEKYEMLAQFFNSLETSYRLLRLKRKMCTFSSIAHKIEYLTHKRFTCRHLAQLKHLVPEAISVKKMLSLDEATSCMKPDLQITLHSDAYGDIFEGKWLTGYAVMTKVFRSRLLDFCKEHDEEEDIPEHELPEPFTCKKSTPSVDMVEELTLASGPSLPVIDELESSGQSFQSRFSQKGRLTGKIIPSADETVIPEIETTNPTSCSPSEGVRKPPTRAKSPPANILTCSGEETPKKPIACDSFGLKNIVDVDGTPGKLLSTPVRLLCPTPDLRTPKRYCTELEDDPRPSKKPVKRPLTMTPEKSTAPGDDTSEAADSVWEDAALHFLPKGLLHLVRERERKVKEDQQAGVSDVRKRQLMITRLPKLFDMIILVFQSLRRSVVTKEELIRKIIAGHFDVADRSEIEDQLTLLQELLPDWITGKMASSGDYIFSTDKISSPEKMRQRLEEAI